MKDYQKLMQRYEVFKSSYKGPWTELLDKDNILQSDREQLDRELKQVNLEIIRNAAEIAAKLYPVFLKGDKENENN